MNAISNPDDSSHCPKLPHRSLSYLISLLSIWLLLLLPLQAADISGDWELTGSFKGDTNYARVTLKVEGNKLTGNLNEIKLEGTIKEDQLTFTGKRPGGNHFGDFKGTIGDNELHGTAVWPGDRQVTWVATRPLEAPTEPRTHDFEPTEFHRVFSDAIPPVLHILPGDTVRTWTVDAGGVDSKGKNRSLGGNPQTGPFFIEGAIPGDTLVVKLKRVRLNRNSAGSGNQIVPTAFS